VWLERREGGRPSGRLLPARQRRHVPALSLATAQQLGDGRALGVARLPGDRVADAVDVLIVLIG